MHSFQTRERPPAVHGSLERGLRRLIIAVAVAGLLPVLSSVATATAYAAEPAPAPTHQPTDLVAVAQGGVQGYCYWGELQGPPDDILPTRLVQFTSCRGYGIPIYGADGVTRIGTFELGGPGSGGGGSSPDGRRREETADGHGTIIEVQRSATRHISITRTWLSGATTTNTAAADTSLSRIPKAERPVTWQAIMLWFRGTGSKHPGLTSARPKPSAWLVGKMSAAARAAGDPDAVARWTLTFRRCAAPLEGASAPSTDEGKYKIVWISVLHGAFTDGSWSYLILDRGSHAVISSGTSKTPFDTSMLRLQGRTQLH
jgi:hypothetical protein